MRREIAIVVGLAPAAGCAAPPGSCSGVPRPVPPSLLPKDSRRVLEAVLLPAYTSARRMPGLLDSQGKLVRAALELGGHRSTFSSICLRGPHAGERLSGELPCQASRLEAALFV